MSDPRVCFNLKTQLGLMWVRTCFCQLVGEHFVCCRLIKIKYHVKASAGDVQSVKITTIIVRLCLTWLCELLRSTQGVSERRRPRPLWTTILERRSWLTPVCTYNLVLRSSPRRLIAHSQLWQMPSWDKHIYSGLWWCGVLLFPWRLYLWGWCSLCAGASCSIRMFIFTLTFETLLW